MYLKNSQIFITLITALRVTASSDEQNPSGNGLPPFWPNGPFWNGPGNTPQTQTGNDPMFPAQYGNWPQNAAMNGQGPQGMAMGWPNPYAFQTFPPPGFMPGPAAYFGNFMPGLQAIPNPNSGTVQVDGDNVEPVPNGENEPMTVDENCANQNIVTGRVRANAEVTLSPRTEPRANAIAGPSQPRQPEAAHPRTREEQNRRNFGMDSASEDDEPERIALEDRRRAIEEEPIPREIIERQERELQNVGAVNPGDTEAALRDQISLNLDLMKRFNELEKMLTKRQLSPNGEENGAPKRMRDNHRAESSNRRQNENDFERFTLDDEDDGYRSRQSTPRGRGRGSWTGRGRDNTYHQRSRETRDYRDGQIASRPPKLAPDALTRIPRRRLPMVQVEKHDLYLESYDERRFGHIIGDSRMTLKDRVEELSALLPTMPLPDGTFPPRMLSWQDVEEDENSEASDDPYDDKLPYTTEQKQKRFKLRMQLRLRQPGRLPTWLGRFRFTEGAYAERDNSFRGMYGPGFTYDRRNNIMYADTEAVEAAKSFAARAEYPLPNRMGARPNPRGFPMSIYEVRESIRYILSRMPKWQNVLRLLAEFQRISTSVIARYRDLAMHEVTEQFQRDPRLGELANGLPPPPYIPLDRAYRSPSGGNIAGGAGLTIPVDAMIDEWCQYAAHHFRPGGLNPPAGLTMDLSHRVSYATVWGMLLVRFLHPHDARNYYARYLAAIAFRPRYYTDYIEQWNTDRPEEVPIIRSKEVTLRRMVFHGAKENLAEIDVIRHLAANGITQEMIDSAYPWAMVWVDQHQTIHYHDHYQRLETSRLQRLQHFGEPVIIPELRGWWSPDLSDTHRIRALIYQERYEHHTDGHNQRQDNPSWLLRGESATFTYINSFPPTTPRTPSQSDASAVLDHSQEDVPMTPAADTAADDAVAVRPEAVPNATAQDNPIATTPSNIDAEQPHLIPLPAETDDEMFDVNPSAANVDEASRQEKAGEVSATKSQT
ncbi:hypothetical protein ARMSODRAFT_1018061 [Armillaria solidipes]|uniref:Uncharacterized protein n=1 Tax=Armillaria solidipes TaxID=1076256 RepID=A0A2H3BNN8_9AGAR|nr:hypothetical protein ARMSODRAFT_1018061 [Armillaria solidipes]